MKKHEPTSYGQYEKEVENGFLGLKFSTAVEHEYLLTQLKTRRAVLLILWAAFMVYQCVLLVQDGVQIVPPYSFVHLLARVALIFLPLLWGIMALAYGRAAHRVQWGLGGAVFLVGVGTLLLVSLPAADTRHFVMPGLFYLVFLFVLSGIVFRITLLVGLLLAVGVVVIAYGLDTQTMGLPDNMLFWLCCFSLAGLIHLYHREYTSRLEFLKNARLSGCMEHDTQTGLHTLCSFDAHLKRIWRQAIRDRLPIAMVLIDSDDLCRGLACKKGATQGSIETVVREMAEVLKGVQNRPLDMVARFDNTQFAILWYGAHPEMVRILANEVKNKLEKLFIRWSGDNHADLLTFEIGVAIAIPEQGDKEIALVSLAKEALMLAREDVSTNIIIRNFDRNWPHDLTSPISSNLDNEE